MPYIANQHRRYQPASVRWVGLGVVALFHVGLIIMLVQVLGYRNMGLQEVPIQASTVQEEKHDEKPPPPPPPDFQPPPPPYVPPPDVNIQVPQAAAAGAIVAVSHVISKPAPPPVAKPAVVTPPTLAHIGDTTACFPPLSKRLNEEGVVQLQVLIDTTGRVVEAKVIKSSGFHRLDVASIDCAKQYVSMHPGMADGKPAMAWSTVPIRFKLQ